MATSGTLNVVCHGSIAFVVGGDGGIELLIPEIGPAWDHEYMAGNWDGDRLTSYQAGDEYRLTGVTPGDGKQLFDPKVNICQEGPLQYRDAAKLRRFRLPPPKQIFSADYMDVTPATSFKDSGDPRVKDLRRLSCLSVLSYDCDDLTAARLQTDGGHDFRWLPEIVSDGDKRAVNLHIFAEPYTFRPLETGKPVAEPVPFNSLLDGVGGDPRLAMLPPGSPGGFLFADIDPGAPVPGLPEPEKLALSSHFQVVRYGMLHNFDHPYDCGPLVVQGSGAIAASQKERRGFAIRQNKEPIVLAHPHVVAVHWGRSDIDKVADAKVRQLLALDFVKNALAEYGVAAPLFLKSVPNPGGSKTEIADHRRALTTPERSPIAGGLNDLILAGEVPDPRQDPNLLYLIVAPPGAKSTTTGVSGAHNYFYLEIPGGDQGRPRVPVRYAWALQNQINGSNLSALDNFTWTLSHELLEACTDPEPPKGYVFEGAEICDIAAGLHGTIDGLEVTGYFSYKDGVYKTPGGYRSLAQGA